MIKINFYFKGLIIDYWQILKFNYNFFLYKKLFNFLIKWN